MQGVSCRSMRSIGTRVLRPRADDGRQRAGQDVVSQTADSSQCWTRHCQLPLATRHSLNPAAEIDMRAARRGSEPACRYRQWMYWNGNLTPMHGVRTVREENAVMYSVTRCIRYNVLCYLAHGRLLVSSNHLHERDTPHLRQSHVQRPAQLHELLLEAQLALHSRLYPSEHLVYER